MMTAALTLSAPTVAATRSTRTPTSRPRQRRRDLDALDGLCRTLRAQAATPSHTIVTQRPMGGLRVARRRPPRDLRFGGCYAEVEGEAGSPTLGRRGEETVIRSTRATWTVALRVGDSSLGATTFEGETTVDNSMTVNQDLSVLDDVIISDDLVVSSDATVRRHEGRRRDL